MSPKQKAAIEHLQQICSVTTHRAPETLAERKNKPRGRYAAVTAEVLKEMKRLDATGLIRTKIALQLGVNESTIYKHLGAKRKQKNAESLRKALRG